MIEKYKIKAKILLELTSEFVVVAIVIMEILIINNIGPKKDSCSAKFVLFAKLFQTGHCFL